MRTIILTGIAIGILAGTAIPSSERAEAQYSTQKGQGWIGKALREQKGPAEKSKATKQTKNK